MRNYLATTVCTLVLGFAVGNAQAACTATPDCASLGYTFTQKDCPVEGVKCPWDDTKFYCDTIFHLDDGTIEDCTGVVEVIVPENAACTEIKKTCPSKCTGWSCNVGYEKVGNKCVKELEPLPSGCSGTKLVCNGQEYCCPTSTGYTSCAEMNAGLQKCFVTADNELPLQ